MKLCLSFLVLSVAAAMVACSGGGDELFQSERSTGGSPPDTQVNGGGSAFGAGGQLSGPGGSASKAGSAGSGNKAGGSTGGAFTSGAGGSPQSAGSAGQSTGGAAGQSVGGSSQGVGGAMPGGGSGGAATGGSSQGGASGSAGHAGSGNVCSSSSNCPQYEVCSWIDPGSQATRCQQPNANALLTVGQVCNQDSDCRSNSCDTFNHTCTEVCGTETDCPVGTVCARVAVPGSYIRFQCLPGCSANDGCHGGQCTLTNLPTNSALVKACTGPLGAGPLGAAASTGCASGLSYNGVCTSLCEHNTDCSGTLPYCTAQTVDDGSLWGFGVNACTTHPKGYEACLSYQTSNIFLPNCSKCVSQFEADAVINADTCQYHFCQNNCTTFSCFCDCITNASNICASAYTTVMNEVGFLCETECK